VKTAQVCFEIERRLSPSGFNARQISKSPDSCVQKHLNPGKPAQEIIVANPFTFGSPVLPASLHGRRRELRRLVGRILNQGQSSALVGEPRTGKTSLLNYLMSPATCAELYGDADCKILFCYFDALTLGAQFSPAKFWERALEPVREIAAKDSPLAEALRTCHLEKYGNFVLERLFARLQEAAGLS